MHQSLPLGTVVGLDFAAAQLRVAAEKESNYPTGYALAPIAWVQGDALALPYESDYFDAATIGYGLRNVSDIPLVGPPLMHPSHPSHNSRNVSGIPLVGA
jgi:ubiquinone/menaquinone biosynthesis C-methylase UbiE